MANTRDRGFSEETEDLLRRSKKMLQQGPLVCFAIFLWVHHVPKLLGGSPEVLQLCGEDIFRIQDKLLSESTRGKKGLALVHLLLFFELFLELGVGLLEIAEIILEEPSLSRPLQLQLVKLSLKINVLCQLFGYAFFLGSKLLVAAHGCLQIFGLLL
jgi:hypothetical protein